MEINTGRILVIGASGFVGRQCYDLLKNAGYDVVGSCYNVGNSDFFPMDLLKIPYPNYIRDCLLEIKPSYLLHSAWDVKPGYRDSVGNIEWVISSLRLVKDFYEIGGKRAVTVGTCFEYNPNAGIRTEFVTELCPDTLYGECKKDLYEILYSCSRTHNMSYAHARLFYLYGPNEAPNRLVPVVINALKKNERAKCSHGEQVRDFMYIEDVARGLLATLFSDYNGPVNVGSGVGITIKDLVSLIAEKMDKKDMVDFDLPTPPNDYPMVVAETGIINSVIDWQPEYTLEQGIEATIKSLI